MVLNVNIPALPAELIRGIKVCRQAYAKYEEDFIERNDPNGRRYYWLTGEFVNFDKGKDTDVWALANQYVSIVPVQFISTSRIRMKSFIPCTKKASERCWKKCSHLSM